MNTQQAIAFFTNKANTLTQSLTALGLGNNGETVISLQTKVDQAVKTAFGKREQLSSKLDTVTAKARQAEDKLSLAVDNQAIEQERLAELQRQQSELEITIQGLQDRKKVLSDNGDTKRAEIKAEIATIKDNITKTEAEVAAVKQQIADGWASVANLVANRESLVWQAQSAQEQANYHSQYVQYWGKIGEEKKRSGGHNDIYGWITNTAEVNARDSFQAQANQFTQQAAAIQGQVDSFKQSLSVLERIKNSKTDQIWLHYHELDTKNNALSFTSTQSGNDLALLDLQLSQSQTDLTQLKDTDIPSQKTISDGTNQRVAQVQFELAEFKTQKISAQQRLDSFNQSNEELLTTDLSLDLLQDSIAKSQDKIADLQKTKM
jgi:chromosome segregation ATPase